MTHIPVSLEEETDFKQRTHIESARLRMTAVQNEAPKKAQENKSELKKSNSKNKSDKLKNCLPSTSNHWTPALDFSIVTVFTQSLPRLAPPHIFRARRGWHLLSMMIFFFLVLKVDKLWFLKFLICLLLPPDISFLFCWSPQNMPNRILSSACQMSIYWILMKQMSNHSSIHHFTARRGGTFALLISMAVAEAAEKTLLNFQRCCCCCFMALDSRQMIGL